MVRVNDRQKCKSDTRDQKAYYKIKQIWGTDVTSDPLLYVLCVHPNDTIYAKLIYKSSAFLIFKKPFIMERITGRLQLKPESSLLLSSSHCCRSFYKY